MTVMFGNKTVHKSIVFIKITRESSYNRFQTNISTTVGQIIQAVVSAHIRIYAL